MSDRSLASPSVCSVLSLSHVTISSVRNMLLFLTAAASLVLSVTLVEAAAFRKAFRNTFLGNCYSFFPFHMQHPQLKNVKLETLNVWPWPWPSSFKPIQMVSEELWESFCKCYLYIFRKRFTWARPKSTGSIRFWLRQNSTAIRWTTQHEHFH